MARVRAACRRFTTAWGTEDACHSEWCNFARKQATRKLGKPRRKLQKSRKRRETAISESRDFPGRARSSSCPEVPRGLLCRTARPLFPIDLYRLDDGDRRS